MKKDIEMIKKETELAIMAARNKIELEFYSIHELVGQGSYYYASVANINLLIVQMELHIDDIRYAMLELAQLNTKMETIQEIENLSDTADNDFGKCRNCGHEFDSELLNEYEINHCIKCGAKVIGY